MLDDGSVHGDPSVPYDDPGMTQLRRFLAASWRGETERGSEQQPTGRPGVQLCRRSKSPASGGGHRVRGHEKLGGRREAAIIFVPASNRRRSRLLTCWLRFEDCGVSVYAFCAMVTDDPSVFVARVADRYGHYALATAEFADGFDPTDALATAMIGDALADTLVLAGEDPDRPPAVGLDVVIEQRFAA